MRDYENIASEIKSQIDKGHTHFPLLWFAKVIKDEEICKNFNRIKTVNDNYSKNVIKKLSRIVLSDRLNKLLVKDDCGIFVHQSYYTLNNKNTGANSIYVLEKDLLKAFGIKANHSYVNLSITLGLSSKQIKKGWYLNNQEKIMRQMYNFFSDNIFTDEERRKFIGDYMTDTINKENPSLLSIDFRDKYLEISSKYEALKKESADLYDIMYKEISMLTEKNQQLLCALRKDRYGDDSDEVKE